MAILSVAMLPILSLQSQFVKTIDSLERVEQRLSIRDNALNYLKNVNLTELRDGRFIQDDSLVTWSSTPFRPTRSAKSFGGSKGRFDLTLYTVNVTVTRNQQIVDQFEVRGLGWHEARGSFDF